MRSATKSILTAAGAVTMLSFGLGVHAASAHQQNYIMAPVAGSVNWSGYIDSAKTAAYTDITGSWTVPTVSGSEGASNAQWIGLGGVSSQALLQMGTLETVQNGQQVNQLFWEQLPQAAVPIVDVKPGDKIAVEIKQVSGQDWRLTADITSGGKTTAKTVNVKLSSSYASQIEQTAEWITEDPEDGSGNILPLARAGTVTFDNAMVDGKPIRQSNATTQETVLVTNANQAVVPSQISASGTSFSTEPSSSIPANLQQGPNPGMPSQSFPSTDIPNGMIPNGITQADAQTLEQLQQEMQQLWQQWAQSTGASVVPNGSWSLNAVPSSFTHSHHHHAWTGSSDGWQWTVQVFGN